MDPVAGADVLVTQPASLLRDAALGDLSRRWIKADAAAATAWAGSLTDSETRSIALRTMAEEWVRHDPQTALQIFSAPDAPLLSAQQYRDMALMFYFRDKELLAEYTRNLPPAAAEIVRDEMSGEIILRGSRARRIHGLGQ